MKPTSTVATRAPQSRGISASLRRLAARRAVGTLAVGLALAGSLHSASAATFNYTGGGTGTAAAPVSGNFSNGFDGDVTTSDTTGILNFGGTTYTATDDLLTQIIANKLNFTNTGAVTLATTAGASNSISLGGTTPSVTTGAGNVVNGLDLTLAATTAFNIGAGGFTENGILSGAGGFSKTGTGTLLLSSANTFTGPVSFTGAGNVNIGNLRLANSNALGAASTAQAINMTTSTNGAIGAIELIGGVAIPANKTLSVGGRTVGPTFAFLRNISGNNTFGGNIGIGGGGGGYSLDSLAGTLTLGGTLQNNVLTSNRGFAFFDAGNYAVTGIVQDNTTALTNITMSGTGTLKLTNKNTYSGGTIITSGEVVSASTLGSGLGTGAVSVAAGSRLTIQDHAGGVPNLVNNFTLNGSGIGGNGALNFFNSGFNTANTGLTGTVNLASNTTIRVDSNNQSGPIDFRGVISGVGGLTLFNQTSQAGTNPAIFKFDAANTYGTGSQNTILTSSATAANPMVVELGVANALPTATTVTFGGTPTGATGSFNSNVTLRLDGISQQVAGIQVASGATGTYIVAGNSATPSTLVVANTAADTFSGTIGGAGTNNNNIALTENGPSTLTLTSANTYAGGTTVTAGTLVAGNDGTLGSGTVSVGTGGVLTLTGGTANNYIGDLASLILTTSNNATPFVNLNFAGTTFAMAGTYGGANSGAQFIDSDFAGTGVLNNTGLAAAPEPSQYAAFTIGLLGLGALALKARKRTMAA